jgi:hypothetical protein
MARENQGLQIALIIFVMLTIMLGAMTFVFFRKYDEAERKAKDSVAAADKIRTDLNNTQSDCTDLKRFIGFAASKSMDAIRSQYKDDMEKYGANLPEDAKFYSVILHHQMDIIWARDKKLAEATDTIQELTKDLKNSQAGIDVKVKEFKDYMNQAGEKVNAVTTSAAEAQTHIVEAETNVRTIVEKVRRDAADAAKKADQKAENAINKMQSVIEINNVQKVKLSKLGRTEPDVFTGDIGWVNQHSGTVWINLGRGDGLDRQMTFAVYAGDSNSPTKAAQKASIEVTRIIGEHQAEARVLKDSISDPIMPGDKLFTPVWSAGEHKHFALVGFLDLTGEGKNDHAAVRNLITMNGGIVDCDGDQGKCNGEMTINTILVRGEPPNEKGHAEDTKVFTRMIGDAERLGVKSISLGDLKEQMGYQNDATVKHYGRAIAEPGGHAGKAPAGGSKSGGGDEDSDTFKTRRPPAPDKDSAF